MKNFLLSSFVLIIILTGVDGHSEIIDASGATRIKAYKVPHGEHAIQQPPSPEIEMISDIITNISPIPLPTCRQAEYGDQVPFPTAVVNLEGLFLPIRGKNAAWLPPDPGQAGKCEMNLEVCIAGIDADGDCVRDDIELYIARKFPSSNQQKARRYLFEYAKYLGLFLKPDITRDAARYYSDNMYAATECARRELGDTPIITRELDNIFAEFHNTFVRSFRYINNNGLLGGTSSQTPDNLICN